MADWMRLKPEGVLRGLQCEEVEAPVAGAAWYVADAAGDGLSWRFEAGTLADAAFLTADLLLDGEHLAVFQLRLQEGEDGPVFGANFGALNQCQSRIRLPLSAVDQNRWMLGREGAWLKPMVGGSRVDLARVDRLTLTVLRKSGRPVRFCLTPFIATADEPERLTDPLLPRGPLLDELGQSTLHEWPTKTRSVEELTARLRAQREAAPEQRWPDSFSDWGGSADQRVEATGFFRTHHDGERWWLVDPDGCLFWSAGIDCVRSAIETNAAGLESALGWLPEPGGDFDAAVWRRGDALMANYLAANLIRAFGPDAWHEAWATIALAELRRAGLNTVANWSEWEIARAAGFPYVRPLSLSLEHTPTVFRDFPDVFSINCYRERVPDDTGERIAAVADRPVMIGEWHFGALDVGLPASGIGHVRTQEDRGRAYRAYLEDAAAKPWCVGVHYFTLYDQSALGRFDGENYNIGFVDTCHRPYEPLVQAARESHERLYRVALGEVEPFGDAPEYLPRLFL